MWTNKTGPGRPSWFGQIRHNKALSHLSTSLFWCLFLSSSSVFFSSSLSFFTPLFSLSFTLNFQLFAGVSERPQLPSLFFFITRLLLCHPITTLIHVTKLCCDTTISLQRPCTQHHTIQYQDNRNLTISTQYQDSRNFKVKVTVTSYSPKTLLDLIVLDAFRKQFCSGWMQIVAWQFWCHSVQYDELASRGMLFTVVKTLKIAFFMRQ